MFHAALHVLGNPYSALLIQAVLTMGFFSLFCPGELTWSPQTVQFWDVKVTLAAVFVILCSAKCQNYGLPCKIKPLVHPYVICPVKVVMHYLAFRPPVQGLLFIHQDSRPMTQWDLANVLDKLSSFLNFPKQLVKLHSLCIGGTTMLYMQGVDPHEIKRRGRWASDCFKKYLWL